eukprot:195027_1
MTHGDWRWLFLLLFLQFLQWDLPCNSRNQWIDPPRFDSMDDVFMSSGNMMFSNDSRGLMVASSSFDSVFAIQPATLIEPIDLILLLIYTAFAVFCSVFAHDAGPPDWTRNCQCVTAMFWR